MVRLVFAPIPKSDERFAVDVAAGLHEFPRPPASRHSSPSSGPGRCSPRTLLIRSRSVGGAPSEIPPVGFLAPYGFLGPLTRTCRDSLVRVSRRANRNQRAAPGQRCGSTPAAALRSTIGGSVSTGMTTAGLGRRPNASVHARVDRRTGSSPFHIRPGRIAGPHPLPSRQFQALFDSLFKVLFIFPSRAEFTARLGLHSQTTRLAGASWCGGPNGRALTLSGAPFQGTWARSAAEDASPDYNSDGGAARFSSWALPGSLAVTRGILGRDRGLGRSRGGPQAACVAGRLKSTARRGVVAAGPIPTNRGGAPTGGQCPPPLRLPSPGAGPRGGGRCGGATGA
ncbi:hypothetical protein AAG906_036803 [Vitis piasezkii]